MPPETWVQYGCFGLLSGLVVWTVWKGIPKALEMHAAVVKALGESYERNMDKACERFEAEQDSCRTERVNLAIAANVDREKSREAIAKLTETIQRWIDMMETKN